jgi:ABC-type transport system involved in multi-copper enzyme maturation permease subunit
MKKWIQQFIAVSVNSFTVLMSDPLMLIMHIFIIGVTLLIACLPGFTLGGQLKLVRDQAMALSFISGCLLASVGAARLISEDIRKGMLPTIMSRPVSYSALLAGKWAGLVCSLCLIFISATVACLWASRIIKIEHSIETLGLTTYLGVLCATLLCVAIRHYYKGGNYMWQANLTLFALFLLVFLILNIWGYNGNSSPYGFLVDWKSALAYLYVFLALLVFSAVVSFFAVAMDVSMLLTFSAVLFFGGLFSGYIINLIAPEGVLNALLNTIIPNWQTYWISEIISSPQVSELSFFIPRLANSIFQSILFLIMATFLFERKEITGSI